MNSSQTSNSKKAQRTQNKQNLLSWVDYLEQWEKYARYLFVGMAGLSLMAYSYMVYTQDQWQVNHRQLQRLKNQENQQAIVNAQMRNQAAEKAEKSSSMMDPAPSRAVFIPANDQAPPVSTTEPTATVEENLQRPIGY
jgi:type II secretory pathway component PulM